MFPSTNFFKDRWGYVQAFSLLKLNVKKSKECYKY